MARHHHRAEITISALREWMASIGARKSVAVSMLGKIKTTAQMIAIPMLLHVTPLAGWHPASGDLADLDRGRTDPVVHGLLPASGMAGDRPAGRDIPT